MALMFLDRGVEHSKTTGRLQDLTSDVGELAGQCVYYIPNCD
jgi:hypothetical protein